MTDDIFSASPAEKHKRRGIAGDLTVFRVASAAAEVGYDLAGVTRVARLANERTRSFGVAFTGCTLPGAEQPLFSVPEGRMAIGLGIHGEPGIDETDIPTADGLAELLVSRLLDEVPEGVEVAGARVVPILNGLGSLKYEEMFVIYRRIAELLRAAGIEPVDPHVGEYCTSFDMAGTSLTLFWLDAELEELWDTPVDTPAYRRGSVAQAAQADAAADVAAEAEAVPPSDEASRAVATTVTAAVETIAATIDTHVEELGRLDAIAGDGDHGIGMQRGSHAARDAAIAARDAGAGAQTVLARAADAWSDRAGGTSGALWGLILASLAGKLGDEGSPSACGCRCGRRRRRAGRDDLRQGRGRRQDARRRDRALQRGTHPRDRRRCEPGRRVGDRGGCGHPGCGIHRRSAPPHGQGSSARRALARHPRPGRALSRAHRDGRRRRPRKELTWQTPPPCAS